jgi:hypothetical protein
MFYLYEIIDLVSRSVKLRGHPVKTGQARRGRSAELTALSMSNGLPGEEISF